MLQAICGAVLGCALFPTFGFAETLLSTPTRVLVFVTSESQAYAVVIEGASQTTCPALRYLVEGGPRAVVSEPVRDGQEVVVRLGRGFAKGAQQLTVTPLGCASPPAAVRRLVLGKGSPDHSARAGRVSALIDVEGHTLGQGQG